MMYSLDEIGLIPSEISTIEHRGDINPFVQSPFGGEKLPIFVAPMTCILDANNICTFSRSKVEPIMPVRPGWDRLILPNNSAWLGWQAVTLDEFINLFVSCTAKEDMKHYILIDVANGHMEKLFKAVKDAKQEYGDNLVVMIGNIANPDTYKECCKAKVDYVRVGIGGGAGCTTSVQTGIHTSLPFILDKIKNIKERMLLYKEATISDENGISLYGSFSFGLADKMFTAEEVCDYSEAEGFLTKVVADGGINTIDKAIKCLALGADYVMMGKCFAECEESIGKVYYTTFNGNTVPCKLYYGQSSEQGQIDRFGKVKSNPEGTIKHVPVTTNLSEFCDKFEAALRSAMSYCNARTLNDFIGKVQYETMTHSEFDAYIK